MSAIALPLLLLLSLTQSSALSSCWDVALLLAPSRSRRTRLLQNPIRPITAGLARCTFKFRFSSVPVWGVRLLCVCLSPVLLVPSPSSSFSPSLSHCSGCEPQHLTPGLPGRPTQRPAMRPSLDSNEPRVRRSTSHGAPSIAPDGSFVQPLAPASPVSRGISHTPPLPPTTTSSSTHCGRQGVDPLAEFSKDKSNFAATDRCLDAACSLFQFEIAEVWCFCRCVVNLTLKN